MNVDPGLPLAAWLAAAFGALTLVVVLLLPFLRRGGSVASVAQDQARPSRRSIVQRAGGDVALVVLAVLGYYQLQQYDAPVLDSGGGLQVDPLLVAAPAVALLAAALLALRLLPVAGRLLEALTSRSSRLPLALAGWEVGRRTQRYAGSVLLLTLALAVGVSAVSYGLTWSVSQRDQADFAVGTDIRVSELTAPPLTQAVALSDLPGARLALPVTHREVPFGPTETEVGDLGQVFNEVEPVAYPILVAGDASIREALRLRADLSQDPLGRLVERLGEASTPIGVELPGRPRRLVADVRAEVPKQPRSGVRVAVVLEDPSGVRTAVPLGKGVRTNGDRQRVAVDLRRVVGEGRDPAYPLRLAAVELNYDAAVGDEDFDIGQRLDSVDVRVGLAVSDDADAGGRLEPVPAPAKWHALPLSQVNDTGGTPPPRDLEMSADDSVTLVATFVSQAQGARAIAMGATPPKEVPAVVTSGLQEIAGLRPGDTIHVEVAGVAVRTRIVGTVTHLPSVPDREGVLVDRATLGRALLARGYPGTFHDEWWVVANERSIPGTAAAARATRMGTVEDRVRAAEIRQDEPLRAGVKVALALSLVAAAVRAAVGFATHAAVSVRERRSELGQLRALGAGRRSLLAVVFAEHALLTVLGVAAGIGVGLLLARLVAPLVSLTATGGTPVPAVLVQIPWDHVALLAAEGLAVLLVVAVVVVLALRGTTLTGQADGGRAR